MPDFELRVTQNGQGPVLLLKGELDLATAGEFRQCLHNLVGQTVVIDFTDVTYMDSTALGVLVAVHQRAEESGGQFRLCGVQPSQMRLLEITGLTEYLTLDRENTSVY